MTVKREAEDDSYEQTRTNRQIAAAIRAAEPLWSDPCRHRLADPLVRTESFAMDLSRYSFLLPLRGGSGHCKVPLRRIPWHKHDRVLQAFVGEGEAKPP